MVKDHISKLLNCLVTLLSWVLVVLVGFTLPRGDPVGPEDVLYPVADLNLSPVAHQFIHSTMRTNGVFKCIDELAVCFHTIDLCYIGLGAKEELRACRTIVNGRGVSVDCVGGDGFIAMVHIQCRVRQRVLPLEVCCRRQATKLGGGFKCSLDNVFRCVPKMWAEGNVVWFSYVNLAGMDSNAQCVGCSSKVVLHIGSTMMVVSKLIK